VLVLLGLLAGLAGGVAVGAIAGARRTATAFDRSVAATKPGDVTVRGFAPGLVRDLPSFPEVTRSWSGRLTIGKMLDTPNVAYFTVVAGPPPPPDLFTPHVVAGRLPNPASVEEVVLNEGFAQAIGKRPGDSFDLQLLTDDDIAHFGAFDEPAGPRVHLEIVGVVRVTGTTSNDLLAILATPAYLDAHLADGGADFVVAALHRGAADVAAVRGRLESKLAAHPASPHVALPPYDMTTPDQEAAPAARASGVVVTGLLLLAGVAAAAGLVAILQAAAMLDARRRTDRDALRALGFTRWQRIVSDAVPVAVIAAPVAIVVTVVLAYAGSSFTPVGSASRYEPSPGLELNWAICAVGALVVAFGLTVCAALATTRRTPTVRVVSARPSTAERLARAGVRPPGTIGAQFALRRGSGRAAVPVRSTLVAVVIGVTGIIAAASFDASLHRVAHEPSRYGYQADMEVADAQDEDVAALRDRTDVAAVSDVYSIGVRVGGHDGVAVAFDDQKGAITPTMLAGRLPSTTEEVALGPAVASAARVGVGDTVSVQSAGGSTRTLRVVGIELADGDTPDDFDRTAVLTVDGLRLYGDAPSRKALVRFATGTDVAAARAALARQVEVDGPSTPTPIQNVEQLSRLPIVLAAFFALIAVVALTNAVATALVRRRRDIAVLRAIGFTPRQSGRVLLSMVSTTALVGVIGGVPLGLVIGNRLWQAVAEGMNVAPSSVTPIVVVAVAVIGALVVANLVGAVPAALAARRAAAVDLRAE